MPIKTAADDIRKYFCFSEKIRLDVSSESSARQRIHLKHQVSFSSKDKNKKLKCRLLQFVLGTLRVKPVDWSILIIWISLFLVKLEILVDVFVFTAFSVEISVRKQSRP